MPRRRRLWSISVRIAFRERPSPLASWAHLAVDLGGDDDLLSPGELPKGAAEELFAGAVGIDVGRIEEIDPQFDALFG